MAHKKPRKGKHNINSDNDDNNLNPNAGLKRVLKNRTNL